MIGKNTVESLQSGIIFGFAGQVEGIARRMAEELAPGDPDSVTIIATGGLAPLVIDEVGVIDAYEPWLTLIGLRLVFERNVSRGLAAPGKPRCPATRPAGNLGQVTDDDPGQLPEQMRVRLAKVDRLRAAGRRPVPGRLPADRRRSPRSAPSTRTWRRIPRPASGSASPAG